MVYCLLATLTVQPGKRDEVLQLIRPLVEYCELHEDVTLSYQVEVSMDDPNVFMVFERYVSYEMWQDVHMKSDAVRRFGEISKALVKNVQFQNYEETSIGYVSRIEKKMQQQQQRQQASMQPTGAAGAQQQQPPLVMS